MPNARLQRPSISITSGWWLRIVTDDYRIPIQDTIMRQSGLGAGVAGDAGRSPPLASAGLAHYQAARNGVHALRTITADSGEQMLRGDPPDFLQAHVDAGQRRQRT
jgi:hypothetical protein